MVDRPREDRDAPATSRRGLLKLGLAGGALLALGGAGLAALPTRTIAAPTEPLVALSERQFQVLAAVAARVLDGRGADAVAVAHGVDHSLSYALPDTAKDIGDLLGLFDNALASLLFDGRATPFTALPPEAQDAALRAWRDSRVTLRRSGYQALRKLCLATYWAREDGWAKLGYAPPVGLNAAAYDDSKAGTPEWLAAQGARGS